MRRLLLSLLVAATGLGTTNTTWAEAAASAPVKTAWMNKSFREVTILPNIQIGSVNGKPLQVEAAQPAVLPSQPMPAVIWIHGGGWRVGGNTELPAWLATHGYFVVSSDYRLSDAAKWPAQLEDVKLTVRWLRANAAKYHVNPDRIGVWGASAGGHLAACLGTMPNEKQFEGNGGYENTSSQVQAVADFYGPVDLTDTAMNPKLMEAVVALMGLPLEKNAAVWQGASPLFHVRAGDPPFLIMHGDKDTTVAPSQSARMAAALEKAGVPVTYVVVKGASHGFTHEKPGQAATDPDQESLQQQLLAFFDKYLK